MRLLELRLGKSVPGGLTKSKGDRQENSGPKVNSREQNDDFAIKLRACEERVDSNPQQHDQD